MEPIEFEFGSTKNIPIAKEVEYREIFIQATEKFYKNFSWYVCSKIYPEIFENSKETYGFPSCKAPPRLEELREFEKDLALFVKNIKFREKNSKFMSLLDKEVKKIKRHKNLIIPADKTNNKFSVKPEDYLKMVQKEVERDYKKESVENVKAVTEEHRKIASDLGIADRMFKTTAREAFVTIKDHKEDFETNPKLRLLNPAKHEPGRVAMQILDKIVKNVREHSTHLKQATCTKDVLIWFNSIERKQCYKFINFDIEAFYPSITEELLIKALNWASQFTLISDQDRKVVFSASKSFLYHKGVPWVKKGQSKFDISMGAYHGAQACELVGLFLLEELSKIPNFRSILYRDDGLGITRGTARQTEKLRQEIIKVFKKHGLKITIVTGLSKVNFLDVTLDLEHGIYKPYRKPGDRPQYVNAASNHPPMVLKNIPLGINRRLVEISSNEQAFNEAAEFYQTELDTV